MATVDLAHAGDRWAMTRRSGVAPYPSTDPDTRRIWWSDVGVHQNVTFPVHPDPISGQHCWHQAVRVRPAEPGDAYGDIDSDEGDPVAQPQGGQVFGGLAQGTAGTAAQVQPAGFAAVLPDSRGEPVQRVEA
jgi:hypothetical protein